MNKRTIELHVCVPFDEYTKDRIINEQRTIISELTKKHDILKHQFKNYIITNKLLVGLLRDKIARLHSENIMLKKGCDTNVSKNKNTDKKDV